MSYIGNTPTAVPLTSADITDGIITSAKIADGAIVNDDINASAAINASKLTGLSYYTDSDALTLFNATGSAPVYACRAWVNFNSVGTLAISEDGNVSSITDNGVGQYTVNFTTSISDVNYAILVTLKQNGINNNQRVYESSTVTKTTSAYGIAADDGNAYSDFGNIYTAIFR